MKPNLSLLASALLLSSTVAGCASVSSTSMADPVDSQRGLAYYLPTQNLQLTLKVDKDGRAVQLATTTPMPDVDKAYRLRYGRNEAGLSKLLVRIGTNGLLGGESTGTTTSQIGEIAKEVGGLGALFEYQIQGLADAVPKGKCKQHGSYEWILDVEGKELQSARGPRGEVVSLADCDLRLEAHPVLAREANESSLPAKGPGYYYRQALPMRVTVRSGNETWQFLPTLVSKASPTHFLPIPRTLFASTDWKVTFENGMPTVYSIDGTSEVLGLVKIPATVVSAYSQAIGAGFTRKKGVIDNQIAYMEALEKLAVAQAQNRACQAAVATGNQGQIKDVCAK